MNSCFPLLMHQRNWYIIIVLSKSISIGISLLPSSTHSPRASHTSFTTSLPTSTRCSSLKGFLAVLSYYLLLVDASVISSLSSSCSVFSHPTSTPCIQILSVLRTDIILIFESLAHNTHHMGVYTDPSFRTFSSWEACISYSHQPKHILL